MHRLFTCGQKIPLIAIVGTLHNEIAAQIWCQAGLVKHRKKDDNILETGNI